MHKCKLLSALPSVVMCAAQRLRQQLASDPYIEWWSLQFDPAAESRAHDHLSSLNYLPVMLQVRTACYSTTLPAVVIAGREGGGEMPYGRKGRRNGSARQLQQEERVGVERGEGCTVNREGIVQSNTAGEGTAAQCCTLLEV